MLHVSTRGAAAPLSFSDALLAGLARDGGLYVPESWPHDRRTDDRRASRACATPMPPRPCCAPLIDGEIADADLDRMIEEAYATFRHPAVCPLVQLDDNLFLLELFHGPTLAFKDVAMQLLGRLMDHVLRARGARATIVGATSGDTGSAAVEAFRGLDQVDIFILYPAWARLRGPAPADDVGRGAQRPRHRHRRQLRRLPEHREGAVPARAISPTRCGCRASIRSTGPGSPRRRSTTSPRPWPSARPTGRSPSRCRPAISATSWPAGSPSAWACRSSA